MQIQIQILMQIQIQTQIQIKIQMKIHTQMQIQISMQIQVQIPLQIQIQVMLYLVSCLASILLLSSLLPIIAWAQLTLVGSGVTWAGSKYRSTLIFIMIQINSQSLEDTQVGYISQKYSFDKYTSGRAFKPSNALLSI